MNHFGIRRNGQVFNRLETVFHYKQAASPRFVLALDKSSPMDERDHWKYVRSATRRLVLHDLADDTELGILSFADSVQIHTNDGAGSNLVRLTGSGSREAVASAIPVFISSVASSSSGSGSGSGAGSGVVVSTSGQESCLTCALAEAIAVSHFHKEFFTIEKKTTFDIRFLAESYFCAHEQVKVSSVISRRRWTCQKHCFS